MTPEEQKIEDFLIKNENNLKVTNNTIETLDGKLKIRLTISNKSGGIIVNEIYSDDIALGYGYEKTLNYGLIQKIIKLYKKLRDEKINILQ